MVYAEIKTLQKAIEEVDAKTAEVLKTKTGTTGPAGPRGESGRRGELFCSLNLLSCLMRRLAGIMCVVQWWLSLARAQKMARSNTNPIDFACAKVMMASTANKALAATAVNPAQSARQAPKVILARVEVTARTDTVQSGIA